jgi:hypothetical protein
MNKSALEVSLGGDLMRILRKDSQAQERKIATLKRRIANQNDELAALRPLKKKSLDKYEVDKERDKVRAHGRAILREAKRTLNQIKLLKQRKLGTIMDQNRWGTPKDLIAAKRALAKVLDK